MSKSITWSSPKYSANNIAHETDSLFFAEDIIRYLKFTSPLSIKFCLAEALRYEVGAQHIVVPPGGFFVTNAGMELECLPNRPGIKALIVFFSQALVSDVFRTIRLDDKGLLDDPQAYTTEAAGFSERVYHHPNLLAAQLQVLARQMAVAGIGARHDLAPDLFFSLLENLVRVEGDTSRQIGRVSARSAVTRAELHRRVWQAKTYMLDHWQAELTLDGIARQACLSPFHFHRTFREVFGEPPMKWFRRVKLEKARTLLSNGAGTVTDIALHCGFADIFSFSKAFKRTWGQSPSLLFQQAADPQSNQSA